MYLRIYNLVNVKYIFWQNKVIDFKHVNTNRTLTDRCYRDRNSLSKNDNIGLHIFNTLIQHLIMCLENIMIDKKMLSILCNILCKIYRPIYIINTQIYI